MENPPPRLDDLIAFIHQQQPAAALDQVSTAVLVAERLGEVADHLVGFFVDQARADGASWSDIGRSLGVTKQAAQKRFVPRSGDDAGAGALFWSRFTEPARLAVVRAEREAHAAGHDAVDTGHLLLALTADAGSLACRAIVAQGVPLDALHGAARGALGPAGGAVPEHLPFSVRLKKVHELTVREALRLGQSRVGTQHILLALLADEQTTGGGPLTDLGIDRAA
ncbi:MAG TPA: Clp protease N-terminal domain-containing protein, partial [Euzebyales bacterium]|nr:Clp protease N-terminal domain-containing protein [Euzebyales bacterium]